MDKKVLVIGAGIGGCVAARLTAEQGCKVKVIDMREHVAGNCYDYRDENGIMVHKFGPHLFHTNNEMVVDFLSNYTEWIPYEHKVKALWNDQYLTLPVNKETSEIVGKENVLDIFFRPYTKKMWGIELDDLNPSIINRVPIRDDMNEKYFPNDKFQALPKEGYTQMCKNMLDHENIEVVLNTKYEKSMDKEYDHIFSTMPIDAFYDFKFGDLPYRSIKFHKSSEKGTKSPHVCVNYTDTGKHTRWTEWKNLPYPGNNDSGMTTITHEEPCDYKDNNNERYYPISDREGVNRGLFKKYEEHSKSTPNVTHLGRLGLYAYLDMHMAVNSSIIIVDKWIQKNMS